MSSAHDGRQGSHRDPSRRLRYDDLSAILARTYALGRGGEGAGAATAPPWLPRSHSGRRFVLVAGLAVLVIWGVLYLVFRDWRARYRERAAYGASQVVPAIDRMAEILPPDVDPAAWRDAVDRTHAMLLTVTASNLLSIDEMQALRTELDQTVEQAHAHPETGLTELASVWNTLADRAGFLFTDSRAPSGDRHPRPAILPPRSDTSGKPLQSWRSGPSSS
jgi:hypothetical protein